MATGTRTWGIELQTLLGELAEAQGSPDRILRPADVTPLARDLDARVSLLRSVVTRRDRLLEERRRLEASIHGYGRALELLEATDQVDAGPVERSLRSRVHELRRRLVELADDIAPMQRRVERLEVEVESLRGRIVTELRHAVEAARVNRLATRTHARGLVERSRTDPIDLEVLWSPVPVTGYRAWNIRHDGLYGARRRWLRPTLTAGCREGLDVPHVDGRCAEVAFGCGIYAAKSVPRLLADFDIDGDTRVAVGRVDLEGRVVEHDHGYRAQQATVRALAVVDRDVVRFAADEERIRGLFIDPREAPLLAAQVGRLPLPTRELRRLIDDLIREPADGYARRLSGEPGPA